MKCFIFIGAATLLASSGCKPVVSDPEQEEPGTGAGPSSYTSALAMRGADVSDGVVQMLQPESLVLFLASAPLTCVDPLTTRPCSADPAWQQLILSIPPELNRAGVVNLDDPRIGYAHSTGFDGCDGPSGGWGNGYWGTLDIVSLDATSVSVTVSGAPVSSEVSFDGDYVAERCGEVPVTPPPTPAVAVTGAGLSGNPSSGTGPQADPNALYIFGGTAPGTCEEPVPVVDCGTNRHFVFSLPEALRVPGVIQLNDLQIDAIHTGTSCGPATFHEGTVEISSIDAAHIAFTIAGAGWSGLNGRYEASICP